MTDELPEGDAAPDPAPAPPTPEASAPAKLPDSVSAAAVLLLIFGVLAAFGTALALLATVSSGMRRFAYAGPELLRAPMRGPVDGPMNGQFGDPTVGMYLVPDGGHVFFLGLLFVVLVGMLGAAIAGAHAAAGLAILQRRSWGRLLGMTGSGAALIVLVMGLISTLLWTSVVTPLGLDDMPRHMGGNYRSVTTAVIGFGMVATLLMITAYAFILGVLARHGDDFD